MEHNTAGDKTSFIASSKDYQFNMKIPDPFILGRRRFNDHLQSKYASFQNIENLKDTNYSKNIKSSASTNIEKIYNISSSEESPPKKKSFKMLAERINLLNNCQNKWNSRIDNNKNSEISKLKSMGSIISNRREALLQASDDWKNRVNKGDNSKAIFCVSKTNITTKPTSIATNNKIYGEPKSCISSQRVIEKVYNRNSRKEEDRSKNIVNINGTQSHSTNLNTTPTNRRLIKFNTPIMDNITNNEIKNPGIYSEISIQADSTNNVKLLTRSSLPKGPPRRRPTAIGGRIIPYNDINKNTEENNISYDKEMTIPIQNLLKLLNSDKEICEEIERCNHNDIEKSKMPLIFSKEDVPEDFDIMSAGAGVKLKKAVKRSSFPDVMLIKIQGIKYVTAHLVPPHYSEIHKNATFLLVTSDRLFLFKGSNSNVLERTKATQMISDIIANNELNCSISQVEIAEEHQSTFWNLLKGKGDFEKDSSISIENEEEVLKRNIFYEVTDTGEIILLTQSILPRKCLLDSKKLIICDFDNELYLWIGRNNSKKYIGSGMKMLNKIKNFKIASDSLYKRPDWMVVRKITSGLQDCLFNGKFVDYKDPSIPMKKLLKVFNKEEEKKVVKRKIFTLPSNERKPNEDDESLAGRIGENLTKYPIKEHVLVLEDTELRWNDKNLFTESLICFKLKGDKMTEIEKENEKYIFGDNQCYIVEWKYRIQRDDVKKLNGDSCNDKETGRQRKAYFYWIGRYCRKKEQGLCALTLRKIDNQKIAHVRVEQGKEIPMFRSLFCGRLVIVSGNEEKDENCPKSGKKLYIVRGGPESQTMVGEQIYPPYILNQQTCYLEKEGNSIRILKGELASKNVIEGAERLAITLGSKNTPIYSINSTNFANRSPKMFEEAPRIFRIFDKDAEECYSVHTKKENNLFTFDQDELCDTMLVDQGNILWVWSFTYITTFALQVAKSYWKNRRGDITVLHKGKETESFKALFPVWRDFEDSNEQLPSEKELSVLLTERTSKRSLKEIQERQLPEGCDLSCLEKYLSDCDFEAVFKMSREKFNSLQKWKQIELKKSVNLF
uniref:HP domain-containing protein n=1 Tax=Strongyloides venezuelensis TaxID=75913 RepID=A0A0K0G3E7_STRVS